MLFSRCVDISWLKMVELLEYCTDTVDIFDKLGWYFLLPLGSLCVPTVIW